MINPICLYLSFFWWLLWVEDDYLNGYGIEWWDI